MESDLLTHPFVVAPATAALAAACTCAVTFWRRRRRPASARVRAPAIATGELTYRDAPTVRIADAQRVDRRRKLVRLEPGDNIDLLEAHAGLPPRFRITLRRIVDRQDGAGAHIAVDFGGAAVSCGPLVDELGFNEFVLPRTTRDEPRSTVYHYRESGDALDFMRIKLRAVDAAANCAELDVLQVSGYWRSAV